MKPGVTSAKSAELGEADKSIRPPDKEAEVPRGLWRMCRKNPDRERPLPGRSQVAVDGIPPALARRVSKLARATYYRWLQDLVGPAGAPLQQHGGVLCDAHGDEFKIVSRSVAHGSLQAQLSVANRTARRPRRAEGVTTAILKTRLRRYKKPGPLVCNDLLQRDLTEEGPNRVW